MRYQTRDSVKRALVAGRITKKQASGYLSAIARHEKKEAEYHAALNDYYDVARKIAAVRLGEGKIKIMYGLGPDVLIDAMRVFPRGDGTPDAPYLELEVHMTITPDDIQNYRDLDGILETGDA